MTPAVPQPMSLDRLQQRALIGGGLLLALSVVGLFISPVEFFRSYLVGFLFVSGLALGSLGVTMLHNVVGGNWGVVIKRLLDSGLRTIPLVGLLLVPLFFGLPTLYLWARPDAVAHDAVLQHKAPYMNVPFFVGRSVLYFLIWGLYAFLLTRWSPERNEPVNQGRLRRISAPGLLVFGFTVTFAVVDWVMSLEPHWFSTMYGAIFLVGQALSTLAFSVAILALLSSREPFRNFVQPQHFHDLGNLMLAFTMLWAYTSFSQFLIIWSGNLPEETPFYLKRLNSGYDWIAAVLLVFQFVIPFMLLLQRFVKRRARLISRLAVLIVVMRVVDLYWQVVPSISLTLAPHWLDVVLPLGMFGVWLWVYLWALKQRPLLPHDAKPLGGHH